MIWIDILTHLGIVVAGSILGSLIFSCIFIFIVKRSILTSASKMVSQETREGLAIWVQDQIKNGIGEALQDDKVKKIIVDILELVKDRISGGDKRE